MFKVVRKQSVSRSKKLEFLFLFVILKSLARPDQDGFRLHSAREGDIELAVSKTLVVQIDPRI